MIRTINELLNVIGKLENKETPIHYIYRFLGGEEKLEFPKEWFLLDTLSKEIEPRFLSRPPPNIALRHFIKDKATISKIKTLLEQHINHGIKESFLIISIALAVDLVLKFCAFQYRDGLDRLKQDLKRIKEKQRLKKGLGDKSLKTLIATLEKLCVYDKEKEAIFARDYVIWRKLTSLDNGIDLFHDYGDLPRDPSKSLEMIERLRRQLHFDED
ncbi:hypothetical protein ES702_04354 [subsurface metagenome]